MTVASRIDFFLKRRFKKFKSNVSAVTEILEARCRRHTNLYFTRIDFLGVGFFEIVGVSRWVDQAGLEVCLPSAEIKGLSHYASGLYVF